MKSYFPGASFTLLHLAPFFYPTFFVDFLRACSYQGGDFSRGFRHSTVSTGQVISVGLFDSLERAVIKKLMKSSEKQPWVIVLLVLFISRKKSKKKGPPLGDEAYWRQIGGL
jgi:hypothetical protein